MPRRSFGIIKPNEPVAAFLPVGTVSVEVPEVRSLLRLCYVSEASADLCPGLCYVSEASADSGFSLCYVSEASADSGSGRNSRTVSIR